MTRLRAPKPMATPATPAEASSGARLILKVSRIISAAVPTMRNEATERSTEPIACDRWRRRSALTSSPPRAVPSTAEAVRFIRSMRLVIVLRMTIRSAAATTMISRMRSPVSSHVDQFSDTQPAASVARSWASSSVTVSSRPAAGADGNTGYLRAVTSRPPEYVSRRAVRRGEDGVDGFSTLTAPHPRAGSPSPAHHPRPAALPARPATGVADRTRGYPSRPPDRSHPRSQPSVRSHGGPGRGKTPSPRYPDMVALRPGVRGN